MRLLFRPARLAPRMRVLFDHGTPSGIARSLAGHEITEAIARGWDRISNGELLNLAEANGFDLLLTTDKKIQYQQNLTGRKIAILVLGNSTWPVVRLYLERIASAVSAARPVKFCGSGYPLRIKPRLLQRRRLRFNLLATDQHWLNGLV